MSVHAILKSAILGRRCVMLRGEGLRRKLCPHALGFKNKRLKLLAFQYGGDSASGLPASGGWRSFLVDGIEWAELTDGAWRSSDDYLAKLETTFDRVECQARPLRRTAK
jgi:hypothetical protein